MNLNLIEPLRKIKILIVLIQIFFLAPVYGQKPMVSAHRNRQDCWDSLKNKIYRSDLACFTIEGGNYEKRDSLIAANLFRFDLKSFSDSSLVLKHGNTVVVINAVPFDTNVTKEFTLINSDAFKNYLLLIKNHAFWGTDGGFPRRKLEAIKIDFVNTQLIIPNKAIEDLYEPNFCYPKQKPTKPYCLSEAFYSKDKKRLYVYMLNGDGAGGYEVTFIFENRRYVGRVVDYGF